MRKLILSMLIVLGTIASIQAQASIFNLACPIVNNNNGFVPAEWETISDGFSPDQIDSLIADGYRMDQDSNGNELLSQLFEDIEVTFDSSDLIFLRDSRVSVQVGAFYDNGAGPFEYKVSARAGQGTVRTLYHDTQTSEVVDYLINIYADQDRDDDGFTNEEEVLLASYVIVTDDNSGATSPMFADNEGQYQIETSNYDGGYIIIEPVQNGFHVFDEDFEVDETHDTLQEAIDAALAYANE